MFGRQQDMPRSRCQPDEFFGKLRHVDIHLGQDKELTEILIRHSVLLPEGSLHRERGLVIGVRRTGRSWARPILRPRRHLRGTINFGMYLPDGRPGGKGGLWSGGEWTRVEAVASGRSPSGSSLATTANLRTNCVGLRRPLLQGAHGEEPEWPQGCPSE